MDLSNITILFIPAVLTAVQSGININAKRVDFFSRYSNNMLFALLAVMLSYMKVMSFSNVKLFNIITMTGLDLAQCFFLLIVFLLFLNYIIINNVKKVFVRNLLSLLLFVPALAGSFFIIFYKYFLT